MDKKEKPVLRATAETRQQLKVIAAVLGETMQEVIARLVKDEYERITKKKV
jgi:hypothetical protein